MSLVDLELTALTLTCKSTEIVYAAKNEVKTATIPGPVAVPTGGTPPYTVTPDPTIAFSVTGAPTTYSSKEYKVTDAAGNTSTCLAVVVIAQGESMLKIPRGRPLFRLGNMQFVRPLSP